MKTSAMIMIGGGLALAYFISQRGAMTNSIAAPASAANGGGGQSWRVFVKIYQGQPVEILRQGALASAQRQAASGAPFQVVPATITA